MWNAHNCQKLTWSYNQYLSSLYGHIYSYTNTRILHTYRPYTKALCVYSPQRIVCNLACWALPALALCWHFNLNSSWKLQKCSIYFFALFVCWFCPSTYKNGQQIMNRKCACQQKGKLHSGWKGVGVGVGRSGSVSVGVAIEWGKLHICMSNNWRDWPSSLPHNGHTSIFNGHIFICSAIYPFFYNFFFVFRRPYHSYFPFLFSLCGKQRGKKRMEFIYANIAKLIYGHGCLMAGKWSRHGDFFIDTPTAPMSRSRNSPVYQLKICTFPI